MNLQILYADTLFLSNLVMNLLALSLTGAIMHVKGKKSRLWLSSALGGVYATLAVVFAFPGVLHIIAGLLLSTLLVAIAFGGTGMGRGLFFRTFALFYFSSILLGGGIEALFSLLEGTLGMRTDLVFRPADAVLFIGFLAYFVMRAVSRFLGGGDLPHSVLVRITYGDRSVTVPLLVDSGCRLSYPISGKGAILVSLSALRTVLPSPVISSAEGKRITIPGEHSLAGRCRLLPTVGVSGERLLLAFRADEVTLVADGGSLDVWVALYTGNTARFGGCRGLFPSSLLYARASASNKEKQGTNKKRKGGLES